MLRRRSTVRAVVAFAALLGAAAAQDAPVLVKGGRVHARPGAPVEEASVLVEGGKIKAVGKDIVAPEGAVIVDAAGFDVYPSLIDPLNDGLLETYPTNRGALGGGDRALDVYDRFADRHRALLQRAGVGVVGLGAPVGGMRSGVAAVMFTVPADDDSPIVLAPDRFVQFDVAARGRAGGGDPVGPGGGGRGGRRGGNPLLGGGSSATVAALPQRDAALKSLEESFESAKKYREAWEKYEKDFAEYEKKLKEGKGAASAPADSKAGAAEEKKDDPAARSTLPEGFRNWPRERRNEWMRENMQRAGAGGAETPRGTSAPAASNKLKPPDKPKVEPEKEALVRVLKQETPLWIGAEWAQDMGWALDMAEKRDIRVAVLGGHEAARVIDRLKAARAIVVLAPTVIHDEDQLGGAPEDLARTLARAGVPFTFATAGHSAYGPAGLPLIAALAVGGGITEDEALAATTTHAAAVLGLSKSLGTIEPGKEAHLMILKGSPFAPGAKVRTIVQRGKVVDLGDAP